MSTFDEELQAIIDDMGDYWRSDRWEYPMKEGDKTFQEQIQALIKKHQPEPITGVVPTDKAAALGTMSYNHALEDSDKAYGLEKDYSCEICGADPMGVDCNNANCDR